MQIPDGFNFKTHEGVTININDSEGDALYEVFTQFRSPNPQTPDSLQLNYDEVIKDDIIYNFKFSGFTQNGVLEQRISVPTYSNEVFIRRKGPEGYTEYTEYISNGNVTLNHSKSLANKGDSYHNTGVTYLSSTLTSDVFVNGNVMMAAGLNSNGFDLEVTGTLTISGNINLAGTTSVTCEDLYLSGTTNLNSGSFHADKVTISGWLNGPGYVYYCTSKVFSGGQNNNQGSNVFQQQCGTDSDGDGVLDADDAYPNDSDKAYQIYSPSPSGYATILYEDLWPSFGDYDFNDVAFRYRSLVITNAQNQAVQVDLICDVKNSNATFINGIGIEFTGVDPTAIGSVTGPIYSQGYISNNSNGTESGQDNAVVIITDNADNLLSQITVSIDLSSPISTSSLGESPFNPFIISDQNRAREIHLPSKPLTTLGSSSYENGGVNSDPTGNFISTQGYSWALSFLEDVPTPKESVRISNAYNYFESWATSGGINNVDWYKNTSGNRNSSLLDE
jgi:LruC domain-containing protein